MKTIILYESKHGCTEKCANYVKNKNDVDISRISTFKENITTYENVIIMGPVYMGKINKIVLDYLNKFKDELLLKQLSIIICGMNSEGFNEMIKHNIDEVLRDHAEILYGGGAYYLEKLGFIQKRIVKSIAKVTQSSEHINYENLDKIKI